jgi:hypothetical protein
MRVLGQWALARRVTPERSVGAPVPMRGMPVGEIRNTPLAPVC